MIEITKWTLFKVNIIRYIRRLFRKEQKVPFADLIIHGKQLSTKESMRLAQKFGLK